MTTELKLRSALTEYFDDRKREGGLLEDVMDDLERIVKETIDQQCKDNQI